MNLEEEVEKECFFTKFGRLGRHLALPLIATAALATATCSKKKNSMVGPENQPPETTIVSSPSGTINTDKVTFKWKGEDKDGNVEKFHYFLVKSDTLFIEDNYTKEAQKNFTGLSEGNYKFGVAAVDNDEAVDQTPATSSFTVDLKQSNIRYNEPPETTIISGPSGVVNSNSVTFEWIGESSSFGIDMFRYDLENLDGRIIYGASLVDRDTNKTFNNLDEGDYIFSVWAIDKLGLFDHTPAIKCFSIKLKEPVSLEDVWVYVNNHIKAKVDNELENLRAYGGYPGVSLWGNCTGMFNSDYVNILGDGCRAVNINPGRDIEHDLEDYLKKECKFKETFSDFDIDDTKNMNINAFLEDERVTVNVNWPLTVKKGMRSITLDAFSYAKDDDLGWVNNILAYEIVNTKLDVNQFIKWINENKYGNKIDYYDKNNHSQDIKISESGFHDLSYTIYEINTKFGRAHKLNRFIFAIKRD